MSVCMYLCTYMYEIEQQQCVTVTLPHVGSVCAFKNVYMYVCMVVFMYVYNCMYHCILRERRKNPERKKNYAHDSAIVCMCVYTCMYYCVFKDKTTVHMVQPLIQH